MSSPTFTNIVVAGAGNLGTFIVEELTKNKNFHVTVLSRSTEEQYPGASVTAVDYDSLDSLASALQGADVVINVLNPFIADPKQNLPQASVKAGVKLYLPSEFGNPTDGLDETSPIYLKTKIQQQLKELGLPYLLLFNGPFPEQVFSPFFNFDLPAGKAQIVGDGNTPISWTTRRDVARFISYILAHAPPSQLQNKTLRIEGSRSTILEALEAYEASHPSKGKISITSESLAEAHEYAKTHQDVSGLLKYLVASWEEGHGVVESTEGELDNSLWPEWKPQSVADVLKTFE